jgi:phage-related minor tail protein
MGEAGAEAILPLRRGADGRLGVAAGGGGGGAAVNVVFNVTATDAASFRKSEAQVTGMLARAVARGARSL